jgi:predicted  nucleic acid-binding Zn-ribbon protein
MATLTHKDFVARIDRTHYGKIVVVGAYQGSVAPPPVKCLECGHKWDPLPSNLLRGKGCPKCSNRRMGEKRRLSHDEVIARIKKVHCGKIEVHSRYQNTRSRLSAQCLECGHTWSSRANHILGGLGCVKCIRKRVGQLRSQRAIGVPRLTHQEFIERVNEVNSHMTVIEQYRGILNHISARCNDCGKERKVHPRVLLNGGGCPRCSQNRSKRTRKGVTRLLTQDEAVAKIAEATQNKIQVLGQYQRSTVKLEAQCRECGHRWSTMPVDLFQGHGCPRCKAIKLGNTFRLSHDEAVVKIVEASGGKITVLGRYQGANATLAVQCDCGHKWNAKPGGLFRGVGCKKCGRVKAACNKRYTHQEAVTKITEASGGRIEVLGKYIGVDIPLDVKCLDCGSRWSTMPASLFQCHGCRSCGYARVSKLKTMTHEQAIERINRLSGGKIKVLGRYLGSERRLDVQCYVCGRKWRPLAAGLFMGYGCRRCAENGFRFSKTAIVYYVRVDNPYGAPLYKIGVTNRSVTQRFKRDINKLTILDTRKFEVGSDAYAYEQQILRKYAVDRYSGPDVLSHTGNDELFTRDVLGLDTGEDRQLELTVALWEDEARQCN